MELRALSFLSDPAERERLVYGAAYSRDPAQRAALARAVLAGLTG